MFRLALSRRCVRVESFFRVAHAEAAENADRTCPFDRACFLALCIIDIQDHVRIRFVIGFGRPWLDAGGGGTDVPGRVLSEYSVEVFRTFCAPALAER